MTSEVTLPAEQIQAVEKRAIAAQLVCILGWLKARVESPTRGFEDQNTITNHYLAGCAQTAMLLHNETLAKKLFRLALISGVDGYDAIMEQLPSLEQEAFDSIIDELTTGAE